MILESDLDIRKAVSAVYETVKEAKLKAGLPRIYIKNMNGKESEYTIEDIVGGKDMPGELCKAFFEFGGGKDLSVLTLSLIDGECKVDNFLSGDYESLTRALKSADLRSPLPLKPHQSPVYAEPAVQPVQKLIKAEARPMSIPIEVPEGHEYSLIENVSEIKLPPKMVHSKHAKPKAVKEPKVKKPKVVRPKLLEGKDLEEYVKLNTRGDLTFSDMIEKIEGDGFYLGYKKKEADLKIMRCMRESLSYNNYSPK